MNLQQHEKDHALRLRPLLPECTVLLKWGGDFPLDKTGKLALYGSGARYTVKGGTGSGEVNSHYFVDIEQGLTDAGFEITTKSWLDAYDNILINAKKQFIADIKAQAKQNRTNPIMEGMGAIMPEPEYTLPLDGEGDVAIYVLSRISGEGNDRTYERGDILLTETERRDIAELHKKYAKFLLVLNVGGPVDLTPVSQADNILLLSQLGADTGTALADLITGRSYPSGKLTTTWAAAADYRQLGDFGSKDDTRYKEGIYVGYRYFDSTGAKPVFPFGFGLSYTKFEISDPAVSSEVGHIGVTANVKNIGHHTGKEVLQLYISVPQKRLDQPFQTLAAFAKTKELHPDEAQTVKLRFDLSDLASFDSESSAYILEQGDYILRLGTSSADTSVCGVVRLDEEITVRRVHHIGGTPDFTDWKPQNPAPVPLPDNIPVITVTAECIRTETVRYDSSPEIPQKIKELTDQDLAFLNVGAFDPKKGALSVIGNAGTNVAGAAGETTSRLRAKGITNLVMADGPAGLRLSKDCTKDKKGVHPIGSTLPSTVFDFLPRPAAFFLRLLTPKPKKGAEILHQYATAIPIGTAIAQSWNRELACACGDVVGSEMERFGVHLWLAPALNIHRDIRCGRNFEYFSEDPLISGIFAAELTKGVQRHQGCAVTIKHFAANNQETNRYANNSMVSERALREIYLRGFAICIREAQPHALMTSYNLLNGEHTSQRRDIIEDYLRSECGFNGIVMTDWLAGSGFLTKNPKYPAPTGAGIAAAGGDLVMPGRKSDYKSILSALKKGKLTRLQLEENASRVLRLVEILRR
ncbi:MAG: glycoside hydrolase family 3 C-terminal domain-containing protein [Oscillospiraceae bacterium]|nr:glycoside hydrolase family 3 C-terminal domain-containing protein [Oscillospiraceae bacterium]